MLVDSAFFFLFTPSRVLKRNIVFQFDLRNKVRGWSAIIARTLTIYIAFLPFLIHANSVWFRCSQL
jgi:hypothetical protein